MNKLRILLVDDHPVIGEGLVLLLQEYEDITVIDTALDASEGLDKLLKYNPEIVLMDLMMPDIDGFDAIRLYLCKRPETGIVVFTCLKDDLYVYQALEAGARGYALKGDPVQQLVAAARTVHGGGYWLSPKLSQSIIPSFTQGARTKLSQFEDFNILSVREREVFRLLANGKSTIEVGNLLFISPKTVAKHRVAIKNKLKLKNVADMANYAMRIGLVKIGD